MFRRLPFFQRLLSWTKPLRAGGARLAPVRALRLEQPARRRARASGASGPGLMDGSSPFPSRPEMEAGLRRFAERTGIPVRYGTRWQATSRDGDGFVLAHRPTASTAACPSSPSAWPSRGFPARPASSTSRTTSTRARRRPTRASGSSSSASRTPASSSPAACSSGRAGSSSPRRARRSCRSTRTRWPASARATCSRGRTHPRRGRGLLEASIERHRADVEGLRP